MDNKRIITVVAVILVVAVVIGAAWALTQPATPQNNNTIYYKVYAPKVQNTVIGNHTVDGGVMWEPYVSDTVLAGTGHILVNSKTLWPMHPCCVVIVRQDFATANPKLVNATLKAHIEANRWIADTVANKISDPRSYQILLGIGANFSKVSKSVVEVALSDMILDYHMTPEFHGGLVNFTNMYIGLNATSMANVNAKGYSSVQDFVDQYTVESYLAAAEAVQPSDVSLGEVRMAYLTGDLHQFARVVAMDKTILGTGKSLFETYGVTIVDPQPGGFANGGDEMTAFAAATGKPDMGYLGAPPAILKYLNGDVTKLNVRIVAAANSEGSALVVDSDIHSIADLAGKTIASPGETSIQHLMLIEIAKENGMKVVKK
jgi:NitT/TauT family transport system substrate-binding protein